MDKLFIVIDAAGKRVELIPDIIFKNGKMFLYDLVDIKK